MNTIVLDDDYVCRFALLKIENMAKFLHSQYFKMNKEDRLSIEMAFNKIKKVKIKYDYKRGIDDE